MKRAVFEQTLLIRTATVLLSPSGLVGPLLCAALIFFAGSAAALANTANTAGGAVITVGTDPGICDYVDLQSAINGANQGDTIHVSGSADFHRGNTYGIFSKSVTIRGGFDSCNATEPTGRTELDADGQGRVFDIRLQLHTGLTNEQNVFLENLVVINGLTPGAGAGIFIEGRQGAQHVSLENVEVRSNVTSGNGGGIALMVDGNSEGSGLMLYVDDESSILDNESGQNGGGFSCTNGTNYSISGPLVLMDRVSIFSNQATNGGGMSARNCGQIRYVGGGTQFIFFTNAAITANTALESGGGVFVDGGTRFIVMGASGSGSFIGYLVGDGNAGRIFLNQAAYGGGAYVTGEGGRLQLVDAVVDNNSADFDGGGIYAAQEGLVEIFRTPFAPDWLPCQPEQSSDGQISIPRCSRLRDNTAGRHGGALYADTGEIQVARTIISGNEAADNGSVVAVRGAAMDDIGKTLFDDSLVHGNTGARLFYAWTNSDILVRWSTITDNNSPNNVFRAFTNTGAAQVRVETSIIWEDGGNMITTGGTGDLNATGECILGHQDLAQIGATIDFYHTANPLLIEVDETRPYFPGPTSPAIDFCHGNQATGAPDLAGVDRGTAHTGSALTNPPSWSGIGNHDIGAYETDWDELTDDIFSDRYEQP